MFEFKFPDVGEGVHEGKVLQLKFRPGDQVNEGEIIAVVETDKVVAEIPTSKTGTLTKYGAEEGQIIEVGQTLAYIEIEGGDSAEVEKPAPTKAPISEDNAGVVGELELAKEGMVMPASGEGLSDNSPESFGLVHQPNRKRVLATPLARKIASDKRIDINQIEGTGPSGRVTKEDVMRAAQSTAAPAAPTETTTSYQFKDLPQGSVEVVPLDMMRKTIAKNMKVSSEIPTATLHESCVVDELVQLRKEANENRNERLSFLPFFIKALSVTLKKYPLFNSTYDAAKEEIHIHADINIGIAVDTDAGLMVPVIKQTNLKTIEEIHQEMNILVEKAKSRTIELDHLRDGTMTITNFGPFGGTFGNPLIMPPQVGILGFGRLHQTPVVKNGEVVAGTVLPLSLVLDHRVIDGAPAGKFLSTLKGFLENPSTLLLNMS